MSFIQELAGSRTYLLSLVGAITVALKIAGVIPADVADSILAAIGVGGLATLRASIK